MAFLAKPRLIARTELRRSFRTFLTSRYQLLATAAFGVFFLLPMLVFGSLAARGFGEALAAGETVGGFDLVTLIRGGVAIYWVLIGFLAASRAIGTSATVDEPAGILTAVSVPTALAGTLLAETVLVGLWFVPPAVVIVGAFAVGAGTPLPFVTTLAVLALAMASAVPVGYLVGLGVRHLLTVNEFLARHKTAIGIVAFGLYFGMIAFAESLFADLFILTGRLPMGWLADLALFGVPGIVPSGIRAGVAIGLSVCIGGVALAGAIRLADHHWFADPARTSRPATRVETPAGQTSVLGNLVSRPTRATARVVWLRARRAPIRLLYVAYPLFGLVIFANDLSNLLSYLPVLLALYVIWAAGAAFTLNPIGDQASVLSATLTTPANGEHVIRSHLLVGAAVFAPLGIVVSATSGYLVGLPFERIALLGAGTAFGVLGSVALASGVGATFPRFGAVRLSGSHEAVMPSKSAFAVYSLVIGLTVATLVFVFNEPARTTLALLITELVLARISVTLAPDTVLTGGVISLIVLFTLPPVAYVYAARRFDRFRISQ